MRVGHKIDALSLLLSQLREQAGVERLLGQEGVAEVLLTRHEVHIHRLAHLVDPLLHQAQHLVDVAVNVLVELGCAIAASEHLINFVWLNHTIASNYESCDLTCKFLVICVSKLTSQELGQHLVHKVTGSLADLQTTDKSNKLTV